MDKSTKNEKKYVVVIKIDCTKKQVYLDDIGFDLILNVYVN